MEMTTGISRERAIIASCLSRIRKVLLPCLLCIPWLSVLAQGVTEFATVNTKDFKRFGFERVWNPLKFRS